jgi:mono/diheme cytochrome c family protein
LRIRLLPKAAAVAAAAGFILIVSAFSGLTAIEVAAQDATGTPATAADPAAVTPIDGAEIFANIGCSGCHGNEGGGGRGPALNGSLALRDTNVLLKQIFNGGTSMPPFKDALSDEEITALVKFLRDNWGGRLKLPEVTIEDVAAARAQY